MSNPLPASPLYWAARGTLVVLEYLTLLVTLFWAGQALASRQWTDSGFFSLWFGAITIVLLWGILMTWRDYVSLDTSGILREIGVDLIVPVTLVIVSGGDWLLATAGAHILLIVAVCMTVVSASVRSRRKISNLAEFGLVGVILLAVLLLPLLLGIVAYVGGLTFLLVDSLLSGKPQWAILGLLSYGISLSLRYRNILSRFRDIGPAPAMIKGRFENFMIVAIIITGMAALPALALAFAGAD